MKSKLRLFSVSVVLLALPISAAAQLEVFPTTHDFGDVEVGGSAVAVVTVMNLGGSEVELNVELSGSADFAITSSVPASIPSEGTIDIEVTFSPSGEGYAAADLKINGDSVSSLGGMGVANEPPPSVSVADILAFFDASVADGTLVGNGPGKSADGRRGALRNMIEAAGDLIEDDAIEEAYQQLLDAYQRTDGLPTPPDFVAGPAAPTLAGMISDLMAVLTG